MDERETWALYRKGKAAWNDWAKDMLAKRSQMERSGKWDVEAKNDETRDWISSASIMFGKYGDDDFPKDLSEIVFPSDVSCSQLAYRVYGFHATLENSSFYGTANFANFSIGTSFKGAIFFELADFSGAELYHADFGNARFDRAANFKGTEFKGEANFDGAVFKSSADFRAHFNRERAHFNRTRFADVRFDDVGFERGAEFEDARFFGNANFEQAKFGGPTSFKKARFRKAATFTDIEARASFSFVDATFKKLPRINGAHLEKLPLLDGMKLKGSAEPGGLLRTIFHKVEDDVPICYRELKNYAIRAGHLRNEQAFFRNELRSRRNREDKFWHPAFWLGIGYELFSDLGKSLSRPVAWWGALTAASAWLYHTPLSSAGATACVAGKGDPVMSALLLALKKGTILGGLDAAGKDSQIYACLYGLTEGYGSAHGVKDFVPTVPDWVAMYGLAQSAFSAALLFLFLLALRNHFRIR